MDRKDYPITGAAEFESLAAKKIDESTIDATLKRAGKTVATTSRTLSKDSKTMTVTTKGTNRAGHAMNNVLGVRPAIDGRVHAPVIPISLEIAYTLFVCLLVPIH